MLTILALLAVLRLTIGADGTTDAPSSSATSTATLEPVTTTALDGSMTPEDHWRPVKYDPFVCDYMGENNCWSPQFPEDDGSGPPYSHDGDWPERGQQCVIPAQGDPWGDDTPAILDAFDQCGQDGHIVFENTTYYIRQAMNTSGLQNVDIELNGTLSWSSDINYWLNHSMTVGFQNQTCAWTISGSGIHFYGHGYGTLFGNGEVWYQYNDGMAGRANRPNMLTIADTSESVFEGFNFVQTQKWASTVIRSERILLQDIYVNNTLNPGVTTPFRATLNTDGCNTVYSNNITFLRWTVWNDDDSITMKQNSTNIYIANCSFYEGESLAMGSIGQYPGQIEIIENVTAKDIKLFNARYGARIKTWTGTTKGNPPKGGGGGIGHVKNITFTGFEFHNTTLPWTINQCTSYNGQEGGCNTSALQIQDINWSDSWGTVVNPLITTVQCSANAQCQNFTFSNNTFTLATNGKTANQTLCENLQGQTGFECTGGCNGSCPS